MALIQFRPRQNDLVQELVNDDYFFAPFLRASSFNKNSENLLPALDIAEESNQYSIDVDAPGLKKEDIHLSLDNGTLTIEGERKNESETKDKNFHRVERSYGKFVRTVALGTGIDPQGIKATYKDGVLHVVVPKSEKAKPKSIDVQVG